MVVNFDDVLRYLPSSTLRLPNLETDRKPEEEDPGLPKENVPMRQDPKHQNKSLGKHSWCSPESDNPEMENVEDTWRDYIAADGHS